jgi:hypothetical protein
MTFFVFLLSVHQARRQHHLLAPRQAVARLFLRTQAKGSDGRDTYSHTRFPEVRRCIESALQSGAKKMFVVIFGEESLAYANNILTSLSEAEQ